MITLFEYFENVEKDDFLNDCKPIISELKEIYPKKEDFKFLYRGFKDDVSPSGSKFKTNKERPPKDTQIELHEIADKVFLDVFGWKARSQGVFVFLNKANCKQYGITYLCFPAGDFRFVHSEEIHDLTPHLTSTYENLEQDAVDEYEELYGEGEEGSWFYEDRIDTHENDIDSAIEEVCLDPEKYEVDLLSINS